MEIISLLKIMVEKKASDLHVRPNSRPYLRVDTILYPQESLPELNDDEIRNSIDGIMNEEQKKIFRAKHECDMAITVEGMGRFRFNVYQQRGGVNFAVRHISMKIPTIEQLNLPASLKKLAENYRGLILVTGPTGSGKSSTLAAMIDHINSNKQCNIITIEDPIEYVYEDKKSIISQREIGMDTLDYHEALKHVVRQDPDVILLGEMRDLATMAAGMTAAQMGHLVLSTLHTIDTIQTVTRVVDLFPPHQQNQIRFQFADVLKGVVSQRLLPHASGKGLIPAVEVLVATPLVKKYIEENNLGEIIGVMKQGEYYGMQTFNLSLLKLYKEGKIKMEDALSAATSPEELMMQIRGIESGAEQVKSGITFERF
ncbi:MAG: PilT/PilU family type 4a pilus ATPase [Elusimicrobiota bacterium]